MHTIKYPFKFFPEDKKIVEVQKGVYWIKILLPTIISHVNVYVLEDDDEITITSLLRSRIKSETQKQ